MDEDELLNPFADVPDNLPAPGIEPSSPAEDLEETAAPEIVRIEFPVRIVVVGSLSEEDLRRVTEAVFAELQAAIEDGG